MTDNGRLARARGAMTGRGVGALAISPSDDLRWLLGFSPPGDERACVLLAGPEAAALVVPALNAEQAQAALPALRMETWDDAEGPEAAVRRAADAAGLGDGGSVAVDGTMRADILLLLQRLVPAASFVPAADVLAPLRAVKDEAELELLAASARTADAAVQAALATCAPGVTELEVAEAAEAAFRSAGCTEPWASVASGPNGAFPHHYSSTRRLAEGDGVTIDVGAHLDGYASDITRTAHVGEPSARYLEVHGVVEAAVQAGLAAAAPGATCADVDRAARSVIENAGLGEYFVHRTGHGLGLSTHEPPSIMAGEETPLVPGMVFSIEPGVYVPGQLGVRLEEIVRVTDGGCAIFSALPRDLYVTR